MRRPDYSGQFKRDVKLSKKRGKDMGKLKTLLGLLMKGDPLPAIYLDHSLKGGWVAAVEDIIVTGWCLLFGNTTRRKKFPLWCLSG